MEFSSFSRLTHSVTASDWRFMHRRRLFPLLFSAEGAIAANCRVRSMVAECVVCGFTFVFLLRELVLQPHLASFSVKLKQ
jgi:hypothetical protein